MFLEFSAFRKGKVVDTYGKSSGKGLSRNAYGLEMNSLPELHRHDPLARADRSKSPETVITYTYDFKQPLAYHPHNNPTSNDYRGDQTPQIVPHTSPNIPAAASTGSTRPHIGDSPPRDDAARDEHFENKWREVFCQYAATHDKEIIQQTKAACMKAKHNMEEATAEREFLIRNQAHLDQQLLMGQADHHCTEVKRNSNRASTGTCSTS